MVKIRQATAADAATILQFIRELADFENLLHEVKADEITVKQTLCEENNGIETIIAEIEGTALREFVGRN